MSIIAAAALVLSAGWMPAPLAIQAAGGALRTANRGRAAVIGKAPPVERGAEAPTSNIDIGSICEFHDPKHGAGKKAAVLGVCESSTMKAKGGEIITLVDADGKRHSVSFKAIHICLPPAKTKATEPAEILKPFLEVADKDATSLGVEPEMLELAWQFCAEDDAATNFSPRDIVHLIDEKLYKSAIDRYRAFRLLTSDLGKVFFKTISENAFRPKSSASVQTSKEQWCHAPGHGDMWKSEFCFV